MTRGGMAVITCSNHKQQVVVVLRLRWREPLPRVRTFAGRLGAWACMIFGVSKEERLLWNS